MSLKSRARKIQRATGLTYQQALLHLQGLGLRLPDEVDYANRVADLLGNSRFAAERELLCSALNREPRLTADGIGVVGAQRVMGTKEFEAKRADLFTELALRQVSICAQWLQSQRRTTTIQYRFGTEYLGRLVERWASRDGHVGIGQGALLVAALGLGFDCEAEPPMAWLNIECTDAEPGSSVGSRSLGVAEVRSLSLDDIGDKWFRVPEGSELVVDAGDPEFGPYARGDVVAESELGELPRKKYRPLTGAEVDAIVGQPEDYTSTWKCNN